jgi:ABC-2 type transport system permease protein
MNSIIGIAVKDIKTFFRERGTLFWTIAFPIMILLLFTAIFGRDMPFNANVGVVDNDRTDTTASIIAGLNNTGFMTMKEFAGQTEALQELNATTIRAVITIPEGFTQNLLVQHANVSLVVDGTYLDVASLIKGGVTSFFSEFYKQFYNQTYGTNYTEPIKVNTETFFVGQKVGYKENIVPGMLTYPLLFSSMVASTGAIVFEREKGTLKKIRAAPIRPLNMLFGKTLAALFQTAMSIAIMSVLAVALLGPRLNWNLPLLIPIFFLGSMNGIALGLIISCIGRATTRGIKRSYNNSHRASILHRNVLSHRLPPHIHAANRPCNTNDLRSPSAKRHNDPKRHANRPALANGDIDRCRRNLIWSRSTTLQKMGGEITARVCTRPEHTHSRQPK